MTNTHCNIFVPPCNMVLWNKHCQSQLLLCYFLMLNFDVIYMIYLKAAKTMTIHRSFSWLVHSTAISSKSTTPCGSRARRHWDLTVMEGLWPLVPCGGDMRQHFSNPGEDMRRSFQALHNISLVMSKSS